jgi:hypothetical protein
MNSNNCYHRDECRSKHFVILNIFFFFTFSDANSPALAASRVATKRPADTKPQQYTNPKVPK